ncbi:Hypothetical predicted protein [Lecanosticta acicola]|uniref:Uncharacterized protein n=1 Tax=Lecanosticta acicola TaxID=111012 RepID=A0AAI8Z1W1_9PEZI|nr:Hypothetical predicted protein [Lecanosticta acicola]
MTMSLQRPAYLDNLFRDLPTTPPGHSSTSSVSCSSTASSYDLRSAYPSSRPLSLFLEEDKSDTFSTHSKKSFLGARRRWGLGTVLNRRTYPQTDEYQYPRPSTSATTPPSPPLPPISAPTLPFAEAQGNNGRRPSLPKLQTSFPPPQAISTYAKRPLPAVPGQAPPLQPAAAVRPVPSHPPRVQSRSKRSRTESTRSSGGELKCQRCYYYAARNCQGYVLGGGPGDACEACLQAGFFGAK